MLSRFSSGARAPLLSAALVMLSSLLACSSDAPQTTSAPTVPDASSDGAAPLACQPSSSIAADANAVLFGIVADDDTTYALLHEGDFNSKGTLVVRSDRGDEILIAREYEGAAAITRGASGKPCVLFLDPGGPGDSGDARYACGPDFAAGARVKLPIRPGSTNAKAPWKRVGVAETSDRGIALIDSDWDVRLEKASGNWTAAEFQYDVSAIPNISAGVVLDKPLAVYAGTNGSNVRDYLHIAMSGENPFSVAAVAEYIEELAVGFSSDRIFTLNRGTFADVDEKPVVEFLTYDVGAGTYVGKQTFVSQTATQLAVSPSKTGTYALFVDNGKTMMATLEEGGSWSSKVLDDAAAHELMATQSTSGAKIFAWHRTDVAVRRDCPAAH